MDDYVAQELIWMHLLGCSRQISSSPPLRYARTPVTYDASTTTPIPSISTFAPSFESSETRLFRHTITTKMPSKKTTTAAPKKAAAAAPSHGSYIGMLPDFSTPRRRIASALVLSYSRTFSDSIQQIWLRMPSST